MLSRRWSAPVGIMIAMLTSSATMAGDVVLPPSGDVWMSSEAPRYVSERATGYGTVVLGDVWFESPGHDKGIGVAIVPQRTTTGVAPRE